MKNNQIAEEDKVQQELEVVIMYLWEMCSSKERLENLTYRNAAKEAVHSYLKSAMQLRNSKQGDANEKS